MVTEDQSSKSRVRTIRLNDEELARLLDMLDAVHGPDGGKREAKRYEYRVPRLVVKMQQPGAGHLVTYIAPSRNISAGGLSFLHGGFVHMGTRCIAQLITPHGSWHDVSATVVTCRYVGASIHEVALKFDEQLDPAVYCTAAVRTRVLLVEDDPSTARLAIHYLEQLNGVVDQAQDGEKAVEMAMNAAYDLILMDMELPVMSGFDATRELRKRGYSGPIVAATAMTREEDQIRCREAGCDRFIGKPYARQELQALVDSLRDEPLYSSFHGDASMADLIITFVDDLRTQVRSLQATLAENDAGAFEQVIRVLKSQGKGYGFEVITDTAAVIEEELRGGAPLDELKGKVDDLVKLCTQARAPVATPKPRPT